MNPLALADAKKLFLNVKKGIGRRKDLGLVICPPSIFIGNLYNLCRKTKTDQIKFGAQDCSFEHKGAFTGEVSPLMLKKLGAKYVILGHSERRKYFGETNEMITSKLKAALKAGLAPILCIGETAEERDREEATMVLKTQLKNVLVDLSVPQVSKLIIAYEPVWSIGTGNSCSQDEAMANLLYIKRRLLESFSKPVSQKIVVLYGGSVSSKNAKEYIEAGFNGLLVGGASLKSEEFVKIIKNTKFKEK